MTSERFLPLGICLLLAGLLAIGRLVYGYTGQVMLYPAVVGGVTCLLCLVRLFARLPRCMADERAKHDGSGKHILQVCLMLPMLLVGGGVIGPALYVTALLKMRGESWRLAVGLGLGVLLLIALVFVMLLKVSLPSGLLIG